MGVWDGEVWRWDFHWRRELCVRENPQLDHMKRWLGSCALKKGVRDEYRWRFCKDSMYTVSSGYALLQGGLPAGETYVFDVLWGCNIPSNIAAFGWRLLLDRLPIKDNLCKRGIIQPGQETLCPLCGIAVETLDHLMIGCTKVQHVWNSCACWLGIEVVRPATVRDSLTQHDCMCFNKEQNRAWRTVWFAATWSIWFARNNLVFRQEPFDPMVVFDLLQVRAWKWLNAREAAFSASHYEWITLPALCLKCF